MIIIGIIVDLGFKGDKLTFAHVLNLLKFNTTKPFRVLDAIALLILVVALLHQFAA